jgi:DNA-binding transcriptional LysR family regulator
VFQAHSAIDARPRQTVPERHHRHPKTRHIPAAAVRLGLFLSRHLYVAQPSISETVSDLETELGIKLFSREGRVARLTPEGQVFYEEALKTLAQAERSIATAQRAAKGEIGRLGIGFIGFATYPFLSDLLRKYKTRYPGVALRLEENVPSGQDIAFDRG